MKNEKYAGYNTRRDVDLSRLLDWWDKLPREVQESIMEGLDNVKNGNVFTYEQVVQEAKQKYIPAYIFRQPPKS